MQMNFNKGTNLRSLIVLFTYFISLAASGLITNSGTENITNEQAPILLLHQANPHEKLVEITNVVLKKVLEDMKELVIDPIPLDGNQLDFDLNKEIEAAAKKAANDQLVQYMIHAVLNYSIALSPSLVASLAQIGNNPEMTAAAKVIAIYNAIKAFETLTQPKTDKEKAYAAADIGTSYLLVTAPPAGAVAALALFSIKITDQILTNKTNVEIANIQIEINKLNQSIIKQNNKLLRAEIIPIAFELSLLNQLFQAEHRQAVTMQQHCSTINNEHRVWEFGDCYDSSIQFFYLRSLSSSLLIRLASHSIQNPQALKIMQKLYKYDPMKLKKLGEESRDQLNHFVATFSQEYQKIQLEVINLFHQTRSSNKKSDLINFCTLKIRYLLTEMHSFRQKKFLIKNLKSQPHKNVLNFAEKIEIDYLLTEFDHINSDYCFEFEPDLTADQDELSKININKLIYLKSDLMSQMAQIKQEYLD